MTNLEKIREACIKANPDIETRGRPDDWSGEPIVTIRLADVLLAIKTKRDQEEWGGVLASMDMVKLIGFKYELRKDDLTEQSPECISFLAELLA